MLWWIDQVYDSQTYPIWVTENGLATVKENDGDDMDPNLDDIFRQDHLNGSCLPKFNFSVIFDLTLRA